MLNTSYCSTGSHHACHASWKPQSLSPPFFIPTVLGSYPGSCWFGSEGPYDSEGIHSHRDSYGLSCGEQCGQCSDLNLQPGSLELAQSATGPRRSYHAPPTDRVHLSLCGAFGQTLKQCKYNHDLSFCPKELWVMTLYIPPTSTDSWITMRLCLGQSKEGLSHHTDLHEIYI